MRNGVWTTFVLRNTFRSLRHQFFVNSHLVYENPNRTNALCPAHKLSPPDSLFEPYNVNIFNYAQTYKDFQLFACGTPMALQLHCLGGTSVAWFCLPRFGYIPSRWHKSKIESAHQSLPFTNHNSCFAGPRHHKLSLSLVANCLQQSSSANHHHPSLSSFIISQHDESSCNSKSWSSIKHQSPSVINHPHYSNTSRQSCTQASIVNHHTSSISCQKPFAINGQHQSASIHHKSIVVIVYLLSVIITRHQSSSNPSAIISSHRQPWICKHEH